MRKYDMISGLAQLSMTSLGLRIQQLILEDLSHTASLAVDENIDNIEYKKALIHASAEYILALEEFHEKFLQKNGITS